MPQTTRWELPQHCFLTLEEGDLLPRKSTQKPAPTKAFISTIVDRVCRADCSRAAGVAVITNAKNVLDTQARVLAFQSILMKGLYAWIERQSRQALETCGISEAMREVHRNGPSTSVKRCADNSVVINGLNSYRTPHMDFDSQLYVSLCHYGRRDIAGGTPQFTDLARATDSASFRDWQHMLSTPEIPEKDIFLRGEAPAMLKPGLVRQIRPHTATVSGLNYEEMPIFVWTNRIEDGLLHGATHVTPTGPRPQRKLNYVAIGYRNR